jgi:hypothetical protein
MRLGESLLTVVVICSACSLNEPNAGEGPAASPRAPGNAPDASGTADAAPGDAGGDTGGDAGSGADASADGGRSDGSGAIKFQPGWYALYNRTCIPWDGVRYGCKTSDVVDTINTEICPNENLVGLKITAHSKWVMDDTPGSYTGGANSGFTAIDAILTALKACNKYLILQVLYGEFGGPDPAAIFYPTFTFPSSCSAPLDCTGGTATGGAYGISVNTQPSQPGHMANLWQNDWRQLAASATTAYCNRYDKNPAFYAIGMLYWNTSLAIDRYSPPSGYTEASFNDQYDTYLDAARAACPTTNVLATLDFANPFPAQMNAHLAKIQSIHGAMANTDAVLDEASWGQQVYSGAVGSPTVIDYRGVVRYMEEVESPDMCRGSTPYASPTDIFDMLQNGNAHQRARWPGHIVISMASECDVAGTGWTAWKSLIASKSGKVMNGRDSTLRTPAEVKTSWCERGMTCP